MNDHKTPDSTAHAPASPSVTRRYWRPQLVIYGGIQEITRAVGNMGAKDGGGKGDPGNKTAVT